MWIVFAIITIASLIYGILLSLQTNILVSQNWIWFVIAFINAILVMLLWLYKKNPKKFPLQFVVAADTIAVVVAITFLATEIVIMTAANRPEVPNLDYIVVLGAGVEPNRNPGQSLTLRLNKAFEYMNENPRTIAILSGGQGADEPCAEAQAMADYLMVRGIEPDRLLLELQSSDTRENMVFSKAIIDSRRNNSKPQLALLPGPVMVAEERPLTIGIVTNNFHIFRALATAKSIGMENVSGIPASTPAFLTVHLHVREFIAIMKDKLFGDI